VDGSVPTRCAASLKSVADARRRSSPQCRWHRPLRCRDSGPCSRSSNAQVKGCVRRHTSRSRRGGDRDTSDRRAMRASLFMPLCTLPPRSPSQLSAAARARCELSKEQDPCIATGPRENSNRLMYAFELSGARVCGTPAADRPFPHQCPLARQFAFAFQFLRS